MDQKTTRTFYAIWAGVWVVLSLFAAMILHQRSHRSADILDPVAWFGAFPVGWTAALLWLRNREAIRTFFAGEIGRCLLATFTWSILALNEGDRARDETAAVHGMHVCAAVICWLLAALCCGRLISHVRTVVRDRRAHGTAHSSARTAVQSTPASPKAGYAEANTAIPERPGPRLESASREPPARQEIDVAVR